MKAGDRVRDNASGNTFDIADVSDLGIWVTIVPGTTISEWVLNADIHTDGEAHETGWSLIKENSNEPE